MKGEWQIAFGYPLTAIIDIDSPPHGINDSRERSEQVAGFRD